MRNRFLPFVIAALLSGRNVPGQSSAKPATTSNADAFHQLIEQEWQYELESTPEYATVLGYPGFNARWSDLSPAGAQRDLEREREFVRQFTAISQEGLGDEDRLSLRLMLGKLNRQIVDLEMKKWELPVDQMNGVHLQIAQLPRATKFENSQDYSDYLTRLRTLPQAFAQVEDTLRTGIRDGFVQPRFLIEKAASQAEAIAKASPDESPFSEPLKHFPAAMDEAEQARFKSTIRAAIDGSVADAYGKLAVFLRKTYAPAGRAEPGVWAVPGGDLYYRAQVERMTTTKLSPEEFHAIGLRQVEEITAEMTALAAKMRYANLAALQKDVATNPKLHGQSGEQFVTLYNRYIDVMRSKMPQLFGVQPKAALTVVAMEAFRAPNAAEADYWPGSADGSRPGRVNVNTYKPETRSLTGIESTAYHEGIPGHHQQIGLAQELTSLPKFRRYLDSTAFVEGWALYSERLGVEVGLYQDPYSQYGRLENEMWRAVRLVVDTGVHYKHWSRQQMVDYFHAHTAVDDTNINAEVDRYIAWPGQALAYKAGELKILALRDRARKALGASFSIRGFHDKVLGSGPLPLTVLEEQIDGWIAQQTKGGPGGQKPTS